MHAVRQLSRERDPASEEYVRLNNYGSLGSEKDLRSGTMLPEARDSVRKPEISSKSCRL